MRALTAALALLLASTPLMAQVAPLPVGTRIRVAAPTAGIPYREAAVVDSAGTDTLYVRELSGARRRQFPARLALPVGAITRLDVSTGRRSRSGAIGTGALIGLGTAIVGGLAVAAITGAPNEVDSWGWGGVAIGIASIAPWAAGVGAAIGAMVPVEKWRRVIPPARPR